MVTVEADVDQGERRLAGGELSCPSCGGVLAGWGRARRQLRGLDGLVELCPRRSRCTGCRVTHVMLAVTTLLRAETGNNCDLRHITSWLRIGYF